jgi:hypothetical protein
MQEEPSENLLPAQLQRIVAFALTVSVAILYAVIMTVVMVNAVNSPGWEPNANVVRAVGLLGGVLGAVVTAGFARSQPASGVFLGADHPLGGAAPSGWAAIRPSRARRNLLGLAELMGLPTRRPASPSRTGELPEEAEPPEEIIAEPARAGLAMWVAILYLAVYLVVGLASLIVSLLISEAPDVVTQAAWVWIGTALSSAYAFFGIDRQR